MGHVATAEPAGAARAGAPEWVLAVDIGTSSCKAGLLDLGGRLVAAAAVPYPTARPAPGAAEQDPRDWWRAVRAAVRRAMAAAGPGRVVAVGLSGQTPTLALVDGRGRPLAPALTWQDGRGAPQAAWLRERLGEGELADCLGAHIPLGASSPSARLLWYRQEHPHLLAAAARAVQPKDYVYHRLTGLWATDAATWRGLAHLATGRPDPRLLAQVGIPESLLPPCYPPTAAPGQLTAAAAAALGLPRGLPVAVGWPDSWCHILGTGLGRFARAFDIGGTSEVVGLLTPGAPVSAPGLLALPLMPGLAATYGPLQAGGAALDWVAGLWPGRDRYRRVLAAAAAVSPGSEGLLFLPHLQGERAPYWDPRARGAFVGLTARHGPGHLVRAVLEGVAFAIRHLLDLAGEAAGVRLGAVVVSGGPSRLDLWNRIKAGVLGVPVLQVREPESGLVGAGILAAAAAGWYPDVAAAAAAMVQVAGEVAPDPAAQAAYAELYGTYAGLYGRLQDAFGALAAFAAR